MCQHAILRKVMTNLDSILKSRDITLSTKVCLVKAMVFPVVMYGCESWIFMWNLSILKHWQPIQDLELGFWVLLCRSYATEVWAHSVQFCRSVVSNSLQPHELQHARSPCPSPTPGVHPNPCPLSQWCHPAISSSVIPFSSFPQSLPASESFPMSQLFAWGGQSIRVSPLASVLPMNTQDWSPLGWTGWISLQSKGLSRVFSNTTVQKHQFFGAHLSSQSNSHIHTWPLEKP